jgi:hypothetical protein
MVDDRTDDAAPERQARKTINKLVDEGIIVRLASGWITLRKFYDPTRDGPEVRPPKRTRP